MPDMRQLLQVAGTDKMFALRGKSPGWRRDFTITELLIVTAVICILLALLMPSLQNALGAARQTDCANRLKQIMMAENQYAGDWNGFVCLSKPRPGYNPTGGLGSMWDPWDYPLCGPDLEKDASGNYTASSQMFYNNYKYSRYLGDGAIRSCPSVKSAYDRSVAAWNKYGGNITHEIFDAAGNSNGGIPAQQGASYGNILTRANRLNGKHIIVADTCTLSQSQIKGDDDQWYFFTLYNPVSWQKGAIFLRHASFANSSFIDGHVEAAGVNRLADCNVPYIITPEKVIVKIK